MSSEDMFINFLTVGKHILRTHSLLQEIRMSSEDMFANSEEVDNPDPVGNEEMEVDKNAETPVADDNNEEAHDEDTELNNSGDNILSDKTNVSQSEEAEDTPTKDKED